MIILIIGGAKSGKSILGQDIAKGLQQKGNLYYVATMKPHGKEDLIRIDNHIKDREGYGFITLEKSMHLKELCNKLKEEDTVFVDSITSLVTNYMFNNGDLESKVKRYIINDVVQLNECCKNTVVISDYVFSDGIKYDQYTNNFRRELGYSNVELATIAQVVIEVINGTVVIHKGKEIIEEYEKFI